MSELVQVWRGRLEWLQGAGVTVAAGAEALGVSVASVYRWRKLLAMARSPGGQSTTARSTMARSAMTQPAGPPFVAVRIRDTLPPPPARSSSVRASRAKSPRVAAPLAAQSPAADAIAPATLQLLLPNGVVIHVTGDLDGQRLGDVVLAAGQIPVPSPMPTPTSTPPAPIAFQLSR
jgi:hypothetical protein